MTDIESTTTVFSNGANDSPSKNVDSKTTFILFGGDEKSKNTAAMPEINSETNSTTPLVPNGADEKLKTPISLTDIESTTTLVPNEVDEGKVNHHKIVLIAKL
jgi:hypothetical protein